MPKRVFLAIAILLSGGRALAGSYGIADDLQPKTYTSHSGAYALTVDPDHRSGGGPARYTLRRGQATVWSAHKPFTLWQAAVADDGTVGGFGYSHGYNGAMNVGWKRGEGDFFVTVLDPHGKPRAFVETPRTPPRRMHVMADPRGAGVWIDATRGRLVVRTVRSDQLGESWWTYRLADGQALDRVTPDDGKHDGPAPIVDARPVAGTPLTLVDWLRFSQTKDGKERAGARFALVDPQGHAVWSLDLPEDYTIRGDPKAQDAMLAGIWSRSAILASDRPARFDLWLAARHVRASFVVATGGGSAPAWRVSEVAAVPFQGLAPGAHNATPPSSLPVPHLRKLGTIALATTATAVASPIQDTADFRIDDRGRFGFLNGCGCGSGPQAFVLVDHDGALLRTIQLPDGTGSGRRSRFLAWLRGDRWLVVTSGQNGGASSAAWIDADSGRLTPIAGFQAPEVHAVAGTGDGGFVAITEFDLKLMGGYAPIEGVASYDAQGRKRWSVDDRGRGDARVFSPAAITATSHGEVAVLDNIENKLRLFSAKGQPLRVIDLEQAWGHAPNYPVAIHGDRDGGVFIADFEGHPSIRHMSAAGKLLGGFDPAFPDGHRLTTRDGVRVAPDGSLWTSEDHALLQLDGKGIVTWSLGSNPEPDRLGTVAAVVVDGKRQIFAVDQDTGAVHVFAHDGRRLWVDHPDPTDYQGPLVLPSITAAADGEVYVSRESDGDPPTFLHYARGGRRLGVAALKLADVRQYWLYQPGTGNRWVIGYPNLYLFDGHGKLLRTVERLADRRWLETPGPAAVAADGSIAVLSGVAAKARGDNPDARIAVGLYARDGSAIASWPAPIAADESVDGVAWDGRDLVLQVRPDHPKAMTSLLLVDRRGHPRWRLPLATAIDSAAVFLVRRGGVRELWLFDGKHAIDRFALE